MVRALGDDDVEDGQRVGGVGDARDELGRGAGGAGGSTELGEARAARVAAIGRGTGLDGGALFGLGRAAQFVRRGAQGAGGRVEVRPGGRGEAVRQLARADRARVTGRAVGRGVRGRVAPDHGLAGALGLVVRGPRTGAVVPRVGEPGLGGEDVGLGAGERLARSGLRVRRGAQRVRRGRRAVAGGGGRGRPLGRLTQRGVVGLELAGRGLESGARLARGGQRGGQLGLGGHEPLRRAGAASERVAHRRERALVARERRRVGARLERGRVGVVGRGAFLGRRVGRLARGLERVAELLRPSRQGAEVVGAGGAAVVEAVGLRPGVLGLRRVPAAALGGGDHRLGRDREALALRDDLGEPRLGRRGIAGRVGRKRPRAMSSSRSRSATRAAYRSATARTSPSCSRRRIDFRTSVFSPFVALSSRSNRPWGSRTQEQKTS